MAFPPGDAWAPRIQSSWPPVPLIWRAPTDSEHTCPFRSTLSALLMHICVRFCAMTSRA